MVKAALGQDSDGGFTPLDMETDHEAACDDIKSYPEVGRNDIKVVLTKESSGTGPAAEAGTAPLLQQKKSLLQLLLATFVMMGVQVDWAVQAALLTPFLLVVGVPYKSYSLVCLCGPIAGLFVQPYMGVFSDHCHSRYGRRRPFIVGGVFMICMGFMLMANAPYIGRYLPGPDRNGAIIAAVTGLWCIDFANNALAGPCRALIADIAPPEQQRLGNSLIGVWSAIGSVVGFIICAIPWSRFYPSLDSPLCQMQCADLRVVAVICCACLIATCLITIMSTHEVPLPPCHNNGEGGQSGFALVGKILSMLRHMPTPLARICAFHFVSWWAWFHHTLFIAVWVGKVVNQGDGGAPVGSEPYLRYARGLKAASVGFVMFAVFTGIFSTALPYILHRFKTRPTLAMSQVLLSLCFAATFLIPRHQIYLAAVNIAAFSAPWAVFQVVPWAITAQMAPPHQRGLYLGSLNIFACLPQILVALSGPVLVRVFGDERATQAALGFGSILALASIALVPPIITNSKPSKASRSSAPRHRRDTSDTGLVGPQPGTVEEDGVESKEGNMVETYIDKPLLQLCSDAQHV